ncbi:MAG: MltA domain-containing protein [Rhodanobacter sp.]
MTSRRPIWPRSFAKVSLGVLLATGSSLLAQVPLPAPAAQGSVAAPATETGKPSLGEPFVTRYARFEPVAFESMPGWESDTLRESLAVFSRSCKVLARKSAWSQACGELGATDESSDSAARLFFEHHFQVYQVMNPDADPNGRITGYYEPQMDGSSVRSVKFRFPVYGAPPGLYQLDARSLSGAARQSFRIEGNRLLAAAPGTADAKEYELALGSENPGVADKRYRVRIDGTRLVPYYSRQQIETQGIAAPVLAWVADAYALYSMQVQGSGKIRLQDGRVLRVAYAEQNGHPFLPNASASDTALVASAIKTRGLHLDTPGSAANEDVSAIIARLQHGGTSSPSAAAPSSEPAQVRNAQIRRDDRAGNAQVQAIIARLAQGNRAPAASSGHPVAPAPSGAPVAAPQPSLAHAQDPQVEAMIAQLTGKTSPTSAAAAAAGAASRPISGSDAARLAADPGRTGAAKALATQAAGGSVSGIGDPSYVFFRVIPDGPQGPLGALGVPLTAGRSLAVDPRTTPLGAPVFVSTAAPGGAGTLERLMFAQDTGGAIRGSVRGDFFWGFGDAAGSLAASMNGRGQMWLLLPRGLVLGALNPKVRTRSLGNAATAPECVIPDDQSCVEY